MVRRDHDTRFVPGPPAPARSLEEAMFRFAFTVGDEEGWPFDRERPAESRAAHVEGDAV